MARRALRLCMLRIGQHRLITGMRRFGDHHCAAVTIAFRDKTGRHIIAQERNIGAMGAIRERQTTTRVIAIR